MELDVHVAGDYGDQRSRHPYVGLCETSMKNHMSQMPSMNLSREEWSTAMDTYNFSSMFRTPLHTNDENVDHRNRPQRECRAPQKYTPRTTLSNHQF